MWCRVLPTSELLFSLLCIFRYHNFLTRLNAINYPGKNKLELNREVHSPMMTTLGDSLSAEPACCCCSPMLFFPMSLSWLRATTNGLPLTASSNEVRVWERAKLTCLIRCGGGTSWWCGMGGGGGGGGRSWCAGHGPARNSVL